MWFGGHIWPEVDPQNGMYDLWTTVRFDDGSWLDSGGPLSVPVAQRKCRYADRTHDTY